MTQRDLDETILHGIGQDARMIGCAPADLLAPHLANLIDIQDDIARAIEKARQHQERLAA